ncbi:MAG: alpha-2-macroglobulin [Candidatus Altimarinota bacterium]
MSDQSAPPQEGFLTRFGKNPLFASSIAIFIIALALLYHFWSGGTPSTASRGIVYPLSGQTISGQQVSLYSTFPLNQLALQEALRTNGEKTVLASIDYFPLPSGASKYSLNLSLQDGDTLSLDQLIYNEQKDTRAEFDSYDYEELPESVFWEFSDTDAFIDSVVETEQSEITSPEFEASLTVPEGGRQELLVFSVGLKELSEDEQAKGGYYYYGYDDCQYTSLENERFDWSQFQVRSVDIRERKEGSIVFSLQGQWGQENACYFVALKSDADSATAFYKSTDEEPHAALSIQELFNPDQDFKSILQIDFDTPLFDTKKKRDEEAEIDYRLQHKKALAQLLEISPPVEISPEEMTLYAQKAIIPLPLKEQTSYQITLKAGKDAYGNEFASQTLPVETGELKYLGLRQKEGQTIFMEAPTVDVLHYGVSDPTVKLCSVNIEAYAKIEHVVSRRSEYDFSEQFLLSGIDEFPTDCEEIKVSLKEDAYRTSVDMASLIGAPAKPGLYYMTFAFQGERKVSPEAPANNPLFFAVVDSHITMKLSKNGRSLFWVNDLRTGEGVAGLTLQGYQNTFVSAEGFWNDATNKYEETFNSPLNTQIYTSPIELGKTDEDGFLEVDLKSEDYFNAFDSWYDDTQHRSILVTASDGTHLSYVVSKWNSGIADWNFGFNPEQYDPTGQFSAHLYTDRKLYSPGETVHFKAIVRENAATLEIPTGDFTLTLRDPNYETISEKTIQLNDFGSYLEDIAVPSDATLGIYRLDLKADGDEEVEYIRTAEFSVEEFQKPTFKVEVAVNSPDLQNETFVDPQIKEEETPWGYSYKNYVKELNLKADVMASYYSGGLVQDAPFTYTIFKQYYYDTSFWDDCYYGCYWEPYKEYYSEGSGELDAAGTASITIPVTHETNWSDYRYIVEVTVMDPSSQAVTGSGSVIVKIPDSLRQGNPYLQVELETDNKFVKEGESITLTIKPERKWEVANNDRYQIVLKHRQYTTKHQKQTGGDILPQVDFEDEVIEEVLVNTSKFEQTDEGFLQRSFRLSKDGEYVLELMERDEADVNDYAIQTLKLYAYDPAGITNTPVVADNKIAVVAEKTSYHLGDTAKLLVRLPFSEGKALVTIEKKNVVDREIISIKGNTLIKEYIVDDTFLPNAYISVIAFKPAGNNSEAGGGAPLVRGRGSEGAQEFQPEYKVGYAEIVVDKTDKKLFLDLQPNQQTPYAPRDQVTLDLTSKDRNGKPVQAELSVAVIDEALIAILGNIDVDILPKFFQKIVFQTHTALTNVAMLKQLYFARKGVVGGSGGKEGGDSIFTRTDFKNTAFYAGAVVTDAGGKAQLSFDLPDNIGDFRIITIGHSKNNFFGSTEKTISVRQEITVEETFPLIVRLGDEMRIGATVFNNSIQTKKVFVSLDAEGLSTPDNNRQEVSIKAGERGFITWRVRVQDEKAEIVTYTITAADEKQKGDRIQKSAPVAKTPLIANRLHYQDDFQTSLEKTMSLIPDIDPEQTQIELSMSTTILAGVEKIITSLLQYPYGCIEQTISSTLPNAIVKKFDTLLKVGIDEETLQRNLQAGIKRFASMQTDDGGFAYWEGSNTSEPNITPYVVLALVQMRDLGVDIPADMIQRGKEFIENQVKSLSGNIEGNRLSQLVHELHALSRLDSGVFGTARTLIKNRLKELTTHERIVYTLALAKKDAANYQQEIDELITSIDLAKSGDSDRNWYWDSTADKALFTQLLMLAKPDDERIQKYIKDLYALDLGSYYYSTQAKIQSFIAFTEYLEKTSINKPDLTVEYQLGSENSRVRFTNANVFRKITTTLDQVRLSNNELRFTANSTSGDAPVYVDLVIYQIPQDPSTITAQQDKGVKVQRQYFRLGEVKETDEDWWTRQERDLAPVSGGKFKVGETYLVKITTHFVDPQRMVALESYLPAGFMLLNPRFQTQQTQVGEDQWNWPFYHQELRSDRFFASADYLGDQEQETTYYVRAIVPGEFLEPPVSVFPMYRPEIEGHTEFRRIVIEE